MSILSGYKKFKRYVLTDSGYQLCSQWTSSNTVHFDDGNTAQTKVGAINGITDSLTATNSNIALSAAAGKNLQDQVTQLNTGLTISYGTTIGSPKHSYITDDGFIFRFGKIVIFSINTNLSGVFPAGQTYEIIYGFPEPLIPGFTGIFYSNGHPVRIMIGDTGILNIYLPHNDVVGELAGEIVYIAK